MSSQIPPLIFEDRFAQRRNMAWRVEPGRLDANNPLMIGEYPWDQSTPFYNGTVLKDPIDGLWKLWGITCPLYDGHDWGEWDQRMAYATSADGVHWTRPEGGLFLWGTMPEGVRSKEVLQAAVEKNVAFVPGEPFFPLGGGENTMRLNFSNASPENICIGIERLGMVLREMLEGMEDIVVV